MMECECECEVCKSEAPMPIQQWRFLNDVHERVYQDMVAGLNDGSTQVKGQDNG